MLKSGLKSNEQNDEKCTNESIEKVLAQRLYDCAEELGVEPSNLFLVIYRALINRDKGPKLATFILTIGIDRTAQILSSYI